MNTFIKKILFEIKMRLIDWEFYMFHPFSAGIIYPPSFYLRYTPEEQEAIRQKEIAELREMLRKYDEKNGIHRE